MKLTYHIVGLVFILVSCGKKENTVNPDPASPKPEIAFTISVNDNGDLTVANSSTNASRYSWDFGDGGTSTQQSPDYHYEKSGTYTVVLKATGKGGSASSSKEITVNIVQKDIVALDNLVQNFIEKYAIPGATLAISKSGKMVYAKGYGMADKEANQPVTVESRFRIGSQSKTICAIAIMKLVEDGKLNLDQKVFGGGAILGTTFGNSSAYTADFKNITVHHLLSHSAGSWGTYDNQGDIMGQVLNAPNSEFLSHIIANYPLVTKPGTRHSYANFGYFILARIVEKVTGKAYLSYVNDDLFKDIGLSNKVELSGPGLSERKANEVKYYPQNNSDAFYTYANLNFERRDGPGGLLLSATDLLRIINSIDGFPAYPDILNAASVSRLSQANNLTILPNYAYGMINNNGWWNHNGSIPSQYGIWLRSPGGINIAINFNSRINNSDSALFASFSKDLNDILAYSANNPNVYQQIEQF